MQKSIKISIKLQEGFGWVPLKYQVEHENENVTNIHCEVDIHEEDMPEWLTLSKFTVRRVYSPGNPGVMMTSYSDNLTKTLEDCLVVSTAGEEIIFAEKMNARLGR